MTEIERINDSLARQFGYFDGVNPNWRVVWSEDQLEKRLVTHSKEGLELLYPEVREVKKYGYISYKYILERALGIPEGSETFLADKWSYEPLWTFEDRQGNALPPRLDACIIIIDQVYSAAAKSIGAKYKDPEVVDPKLQPEAKEARIKKLQADLFGEDTVGPLEHGGGVFLDSTKQLIN